MRRTRQRWRNELGRIIGLGIALGATAGAQVAHADVIELAADGSATLKAADRNSTTRLPSAAPSDLTDGPDVPVEALTLTNGPVGPPEYSAMLHQAAEAHGLSPALLEALVWQESRWHPAVRSRAGAIGLAQLMPGTARDLGVDPTDPTTNLYGGARYLRQQLDRFDGDVERALAAYNAGPGRVLRAAGVPRIAETQSYVRSIVDRLSRSTEAQGASR